MVEENIKPYHAFKTDKDYMFNFSFKNVLFSSADISVHGPFAEDINETIG